MNNHLSSLLFPSFQFQALSHLDKVKLWGNEIRVTLSKHSFVKLPKDHQPGGDLTKDYFMSNLHRFKKPGSKNYANIYPPSATLHLSNIPAMVEEAHLRKAFEDKGLDVRALRFFPKDHKMALAELDSVEEAITALIKLHNFQLSETNHLRVSFSKARV